MAGHYKVRQKRIPLIFNAVTLAAERTSASFSVAGRNVVSLHASATRVAYTALQWHLEVSDDQGVTWRKQLAADVTVTASGATAVATRGTESDSATIATSTGIIAVYNNVVGGPAGLGRFLFSSTAGGATDLLSADVVVQ